MSFFTYHAQQRAKERYGLKLTATDMAVIGAACADLPVMRVLKTGCTIHIYRRAGVALIVLLDPKKDRIISFLPPDYFERGTRVARRAEIYGRKKAKPKQAPSSKRRQTAARVIASSFEEGAE